MKMLKRKEIHWPCFKRQGRNWASMELEKLLIALGNSPCLYVNIILRISVRASLKHVAFIAVKSTIDGIYMYMESGR